MKARVSWSISNFSYDLFPFLPIQYGDFSVSLKAPGRNKHFRVHYEDGVYCIGQRQFNTLIELIEHYKKAPIYTTPKGQKMYLVKPFIRQ